MAFRIGFGYDVHQLKPGNSGLVLGGIKIPHYKEALGYSDADVLIHAICDAILGAANLRDIGFHFPDTASDYKGIDSKILLQEVMKLLREEQYEIGNIDATVALQLPKVNPHIPEMKEVLSNVMQIPKENLSLKATTTEKMGFVGREDGISAYAVVLINKGKD